MKLIRSRTPNLDPQFNPRLLPKWVALSRWPLKIALEPLAVGC
jgi:hypothetical protein